MLDVFLLSLMPFHRRNLSYISGIYKHLKRQFETKVPSPFRDQHIVRLLTTWDSPVDELIATAKPSAYKGESVTMGIVFSKD